MRRMMLKKWLKVLGLLAVAAYVGFCALVYFCPQLFFYNPTAEEPSLEDAKKDGYPAQKVEYRAADGTALYGWYTPPQKGRPVIVFMHGNSYNIGAFYHKLKPFVEAGYGVFMPEYRGFGGVRGKITQAGLEQDAEAALNWLRKQGFANREIVLYGMSLGSFTATHGAYALGEQESFAGLILEVPFDSMYEDVKDIVWFPLPVKWIMRDKYENLPKIRQLNLPLLVMGGSEDTLVPVRRAEALFAAANQPKKIIVYSGAEHHNLYDYKNYLDILDWLEENEKTRP